MSLKESACLHETLQDCPILEPLSNVSNQITLFFINVDFNYSSSQLVIAPSYEPEFMIMT